MNNYYYYYYYYYSDCGFAALRGNFTELQRDYPS